MNLCSWKINLYVGFQHNQNLFTYNLFTKYDNNYMLPNIFCWEINFSSFRRSSISQPNLPMVPSSERRKYEWLQFNTTLLPFGIAFAWYGFVTCTRHINDYTVVQKNTQISQGGVATHSRWGDDHNHRYSQTVSFRTCRGHNCKNQEAKKPVTRSKRKQVIRET